MRPFKCSCGARIFFDNTRCLACKHELAFAPDFRRMVALEALGEGRYRAANGGDGIYVKCDNYAMHGVCNWVVDAQAGRSLCRACELNHVIPNLSNPENRERWGRMEAAKRRLIYSLLELKLPFNSKIDDPERGLAFDFKTNDGADGVVLTGHSDGLVTLRVEEADAVEREKARVTLKERYRSLLGHFRHESGHYFFDVLLKDTAGLDRFRQLFGDERQDYTEALRKHYAAPPAHDPNRFVSSYAEAHPWEDWAETWAHYLHMVDTLETAESFGVFPRHSSNFEELFAVWLELTVVMNALNRSMGLDDAYPFQLGAGVKAKLAFVDEVVKTGAPRFAGPQLRAFAPGEVTFPQSGQLMSQ